MSSTTSSTSSSGSSASISASAAARASSTSSAKLRQSEPSVHHDRGAASRHGNHFIFKFLINDAGSSGVDLTTGDKYRETGATKETFTGSFRNGQFSDTFTNSFLFVGQGPGNNFLLINNFHVTINANGEVTAFVDNVTFECK